MMSLRNNDFFLHCGNNNAVQCKVFNHRPIFFQIKLRFEGVRVTVLLTPPGLFHQEEGPSLNNLMKSIAIATMIIIEEVKT